MPVIFRQVQEKDLNTIVSVHQKCFPDYFLTTMGTKLLSKFYKEYYDENKELFIVAENDDDIVGFVMGYLTGSQARASFERKNRLLLIIKVIGRCLIFDKEAILRVKKKIQSFIKKQPTNTDQPKEATLLSICILPDYQGGKRAETLVRLFENALQKMNKHIYTLSVKNDNIRGIRFYEKVGFSVQKRTEKNTTFIKELHF